MGSLYKTDISQHSSFFFYDYLQCTQGPNFYSLAWSFWLPKPMCQKKVNKQSNHLCPSKP